MSVTPITWAVALTGLLLMVILVMLQFVALVKPRSA